MKAHSRLIAWAVLAAILVMSGACAKTIRKSPDAGGGTPPAGEGTPAGRLPEPSIRGSAFGSTPELSAVRFEYDSYRIGKEARKTLKTNAAAIRLNKGWDVLVEGHCDERGTIEYNIALGQKRAKAARDYYLMLGVPGNRVATISYGEERPVCPEASDACGAANRRAETKVRTAVVGGAAGKE